MARSIYRIVFLLFVVAGSVRLFAQVPATEIGVWIVDSKWTDSTLGPENLDRAGTFDEQPDFGISLNRYWSDYISTELSAQRLNANAVLRFHSVEGEEIVQSGDMDITAISAMLQAHWNRGGALTPYAGAGIAYVTGGFAPDDDFNDGTIDFESRTALVVAVGGDVRITRHIYFAGELKFTSWNALIEGFPGTGVEVDPLIFSAGLKTRF
ncbi:MAG TPA: OmpW family outer membrane protein [Thermoanaerobaculia bacterium]|nr:OmpW family outer membrane protein [Thermoanaerobaculia bacterium]